MRPIILEGATVMEDNKKFELNDDALDNVAGGAVTDADYAACPFPHDSIIRHKWKFCSRCCGSLLIGGYGTKCNTAKVRYSYATPPQVVLTCTQCGLGFYSDLESSILSPTFNGFLDDWELATE